MTYALNTFGLCFATIPALFTWLILEKREEVMNTIRDSPLVKLFQRKEDRRPEVRSNSPYMEVSSLWYLAPLALALAVGMFACEYYPVQLRWYGVIFAFLVSAVFFIPVSCLRYCV